MKNKTALLIKIVKNHQATRLHKHTTAWNGETDTLNKLKLKLDGEEKLVSESAKT